MAFQSVLLITFLISSSIEEQIFGCRGRVLESNTSGARSHFLNINHPIHKLKFPKRFDARDKWPACKSLTTILQQGRCGGCWAFADVSVMSDRLCIETNGKFNGLLSVQDVLECCESCVPEGERFVGGCSGGFMQKGFEFWERSGIVCGNCKPLSKGIEKGLPIKKCRKFCSKIQGKPYKQFKFYSKRTVKGRPSISLKQIQAELMLNGPLGAALSTYSFMSMITSKSILKFDQKLLIPGEEPTRHAIKIIGWDVIDGVDVWIMANSWGTTWCDKGFCYVRRGKNDFDLESNPVYAGTLKVTKNKRWQRITSGCGFIKVSGISLRDVFTQRVLYYFNLYVFCSVFSMFVFIMFD